MRNSTREKKIHSKWISICLLLLFSILVFQGNSQTVSCNAAFSIKSDANYPNIIYFENESTGLVPGMTCIWDLGDGKTYPYINASNVYLNKGTYTVCLTIKDSTTNCNSSVCHKVTINAINCVPFFRPYISRDDINHKTVSFYYGTYAHRKYYWDFGDGTVLHDQPDMKHTYSNGGLYKICLTSTDEANNCTATSCDSIRVTTCSADFTYTFDKSTNTCLFLPVSNNVKYNWGFLCFGVMGSSNLKNPRYQFTQGFPAYALLVTSSDSDPFCHDTIMKTIEVPTGVEENTKPIVLFENYPNPFSTITTIQYSIQSNSQVEISVFDLLGNRLEDLENTTKPAGSHEIYWNAAHFTKGLYLLKLRVNGQQLTKKISITN